MLRHGQRRKSCEYVQRIFKSIGYLKEIQCRGQEHLIHVKQEIYNIEGAHMERVGKGGGEGEMGSILSSRKIGCDENDTGDGFHGCAADKNTLNID